MLKFRQNGGCRFVLEGDEILTEMNDLIRLGLLNHFFYVLPEPYSETMDETLIDSETFRWTIAKSNRSL